MQVGEGDGWRWVYIICLLSAPFQLVLFVYKVLHNLIILIILILTYFTFQTLLTTTLLTTALLTTTLLTIDLLALLIPLIPGGEVKEDGH